MNVQRRTEPTVSLLQGKEYTPAVQTDIRELFARVQQQMEQQCATSSQQS